MNRINVQNVFIDKKNNENGAKILERRWSLSIKSDNLKEFNQKLEYNNKCGVEA